MTEASLAESNHKILNDYIAGALGGAAGLVVGHPVDTIKVQLQTQQTSAPYKGAWDAMKSVRSSGMSRGFFRGLGFPLVSYGVVNSVFFGVYGNALSVLKPAQLSHYTEAYVAGCIGGMAQLSVAVPVDFTKVVLQSQISRQGGSLAAQPGQYFRGPLQCVVALYRHGGLATCYRGLSIHAARDLPSSGLYFLTFEYLYDTMMSRRLSDRHGVTANLVAGGVAGVMSWTAIVPLDVIKSEFQADYGGTRHRTWLEAARTIYRSSGVKGFFAGYSMICLRAFPVNAVTFLIYKKSLNILNDTW